MKYVAIIESDELSEDLVKEMTTRLGFDSEQGTIYFEITSVKEAPEPMNNDMVGVDGFYGGYNRALMDCGVLEDGKN